MGYQYQYQTLKPSSVSECSNKNHGTKMVTEAWDRHRKEMMRWEAT